MEAKRYNVTATKLGKVVFSGPLNENGHVFTVDYHGVRWAELRISPEPSETPPAPSKPPMTWEEKLVALMQLDGFLILHLDCVWEVSVGSDQHVRLGGEMPAFKWRATRSSLSDAVNELTDLLRVPNRAMKNGSSVRWNDDKRDWV